MSAKNTKKYKTFWVIYFTLIILYSIIGIFIVKAPIIMTNIIALIFGCIGFVYKKIKSDT